MSCVNINSPEYKALTKDMNAREKFVAKAIISKFITQNEGRFPDFVELKSSISDLYNTSNGGVDYNVFYNEVRSIFKSLLPGFTDGEIDQRVKFIDKLELMRLRGGKEVQTSFINDVVYVSNTLLKDRGTQAYTDVRHEVFHVIFNNFLSESEQETMVESFKRWKPEYKSLMDKEEIEERIADTFEDYKNSPKKTIPILIRDFFVDILKFLGLMGDNYSDIKRLFNDVEAGKFTRNYLRDSLVTRDKDILSKYTVFSTNLDLFLQTKSFVLNNLNELMFPENNTQLSEANNKTLFLNQDYQSPLFQNNKDLFKIGLTKADALKALQKRIQDLKNSKTVDPQLSNVINTLSKTYILKDMFDYLQPYSLAEISSEGELTLKGQLEKDPTEILLESEEDFNSLEIGSKELINPVTKISEAVKDFISSITYETTPGNFINIDPGAGFISLLNLINQLEGNTSVEDNLASIKNNYNNTVKGNQTKAVYNKLKELHEAVINYNKLSLSIKGVSTQDITSLKQTFDELGIKYETVKDNLNIIIPDTIKIENQGTNSQDNRVVFSLNRFKESKESFLLKQETRESNKAFIERVSSTTKIPNFIVSKLFKYNEQRNQVAELTKVAGSLRKLSPKFVKVQTSQINVDGVNQSVTSYAFVNKVKEYRSSGSLASVVRDVFNNIPVRKELVRAIENYSALRNKADKSKMRELLQDIIINKMGIMSSSDFERISDTGDVTTLLNSFERVVNYTKDIRTDLNSLEFSNPEIYLKQTSNFAELLSKYTFEKSSPTSFSVSTTNKQKYENVMSNTSFKLFSNLREFTISKGKATNKLLGYFKNSFNNYLKFNPLLTHNYDTQQFIVNETALKVRDADFVSDHQEIYFENRRSSYSKLPIPFSKESPRDWINRNFLAMFQLPILEESTSNNTERTGISYFQQKFQPESAPNVSIIKMGVASADSVQNSIMNMILQEAFLVYKYGSSQRGKFASNVKRSYLPGLEGSTYFVKNGVNVFFDEFGNLNESFGSVVNGNLVIKKNNKIMNSLVNTILTNMDSSLERFTDLAISERATLDGQNLFTMYEKIKNSYLNEYQLTKEEEVALKGLSIDNKSDLGIVSANPDFLKKKQALKKVLSSYYLNSFVNGFFMNQISSGVTQNYKNPLDEIKRQAGVNAMKDTPLIDNKHGMREIYKNIVIASANNFYGASHKFSDLPLMKRFFSNKKQEIGDAQSWDIPEYKAMLRKSFGKSVDIGVITKDVHFEVNREGYSDYRKTASAELTNELVRNNKTLRSLRYALTFEPYLTSLTEEQRSETEPRIEYLYNKLVDNNELTDVNEYMEYENIINDIINNDMLIHKASFESAIKGAKPATLSSFTKNKETGIFDFSLEQSSVLDLNSAYNGIQQAVRHRYIDSFISHFTQLTYLIGLNRTETSIKNNKIITRVLSKFSKAGLYDSLFDYRMSYGEDKTLKVNNRSKKKFIEELVKKLDLPGNERIISMLNTEGISMNNPLFSEKLMQSFFSSFSKKTVKPKHPGGSFVLQSEFGFEANRVLSENESTMRIPELISDEEGNTLYAECYLPEMYSQQIVNNDLIYYNSEEYNKMFGFRLPSSDLHSSVPLKVIGYYPSSSQDNVVIIPSAVTALHGSDFDVDKLFVIRYGVFGQENEDIDPKAVDQNPIQSNVKEEYKSRFQVTNVILAQKGIKFGYLAPGSEYNTKGVITSFGINDRHVEITNIDSILLDEKLKTQNKILAIEADRQQYDVETKSLNLSPQSFKGSERRRERGLKTRELESLEKHLKILKTIQKGLYSNQILDAVLDNISYSGENKKDILFGITFEPVKGYEENSEYSELARVLSDINKAEGSTELLATRPALYKNLEEVRNNDTITYNRIKQDLENNLGVNTETEKGQEDLLTLINDNLKEVWIDGRDEFIRMQSTSGSGNINKVEEHISVHKNTYMAAGLVGLIANFTKGLAYSFHGITDNTNSIELALPNNQIVEIDGQKFNKLSLTNKDNISTQELRSLALNAAIDHVKEQILNVLNVGDNTAKIFLASISSEMTLHQSTMLLLQPVAKELNNSSATSVTATLNKMGLEIAERLSTIQAPLTDTEINELKVTTKDLEKNIKTTYTSLLNDTSNPNYRKNLLLQYKVIKQLNTFNQVGEEVSKISKVLHIIQELPYSLEVAYDKLKLTNKFINIENFLNKLTYSESSEYTENGFKNNLRAGDNLFKNVNLANNENVLAAIEAIKVQIDIVSELFSENSVQAQFLINSMLKAITNNSDPSTMFSDQDPQLSFDTVKNMSIAEKYLKGKGTFNITKIISRNIFNYLTSGLNISYNNDSHLFSLSIHNQDLLTVQTDNLEFQLSAVKSYLDAFLMGESESLDSTKNYKGDNYLVSQINPEWRVKPLAVIKRENPENKFLKGLGVDTHFRDRSKIMTFDSTQANTAENLAEVEQSINQLNNISNIYVRKDKKGRWVNLPSSLHPETSEMNEVTFNIIKSSLYTDKFKFGTSKATSVIPPVYFQKIFLTLETLVKDLIYYQKSPQGDKYYKDFTELDNQTKKTSALNDIKENLFINTIFSVPTILPNIRSLLSDPKGKIKYQAGILPNNNIYDLYLDANIMEVAEDGLENIPKEGLLQESITPSEENTNIEVSEDVSENQAETDLSEQFKKNPSFISEEVYKKPGTYNIYIKVGATGSKEGNDLKYYYKKLTTVNGKSTNNSFDLNLLLNKYKIRDYFDPKRIAIPIKKMDFNKEKVSLRNITISNFITNTYDNIVTKNKNKSQTLASLEEQFQNLRSLPENNHKTDAQLRETIKTKLNVENVINSINEVSLYDSRNIDRVGIKHFKILSREISSDKRTVSFELELLPSNQQIRYNKFDSPLELLKTVKKGGLSITDKISYINSIPGVRPITNTVAGTMTEAQIDIEFDRAVSVSETSEIDEVLKNKSC